MIDWHTSVLLISGYDDEENGGLFSFDGSSLGKIDGLSCTGLAVEDDRVGRLLNPFDADSATELVVYDRKGVVEYRRIDAIVDPHDLALLEDGTWVIVSGVHNSVTAVGADGNLDEVWRPSSVPDSWHPNCVAVVDGQLWVTAFGRFAVHRGWAGDASSGAGFLRNLATGEELGGLSQPHSPRWHAGTWTLCNSKEGTVVTWDRATARWERRVELERYPRGMVVHDRMLFVGESAHRTELEGRAFVAVVEDDHVVDRIPLPCREVYDVVVAPVEALDGLRRGFNTNPHRMAAAAADDLLGAVGTRELFAGIGYPVDTAAVATRISCRIPAVMSCTEAVALDVDVTNLSDVPLGSVPPFPVCLSYRWKRADGPEVDGPRTVLSRVLLRDDSASYVVDLQTPADPGEYQLVVGLVQEGIVWFDAIDPSNAAVATVRVT